MKKILVEPLDPAAFAPFGKVVERNGAEREETPGSHNWYGYLSSVDGTGSVSVNILEMLRRPFTVGLLEAHEKTTETLIPMGGKGFIVTAMPPGEVDLSKLRAFWVPGDKGVSFHAGTWHFVPHTLEESGCCAVIFRGMTGKDDMHFHGLEEAVALELPS